MNKLTPPRGYTQADTEARQQWLKEQTGHQVPEFALDSPENLKGLIENHLSFVGLPMSVSGPLKIDGTYAQGDGRHHDGHRIQRHARKPLQRND